MIDTVLDPNYNLSVGVQLKLLLWRFPETGVLPVILHFSGFFFFHCHPGSLKTPLLGTSFQSGDPCEPQPHIPIRRSLSQQLCFAGRGASPREWWRPMETSTLLVGGWVAPRIANGCKPPSYMILWNIMESSK